MTMQQPGAALQHLEAWTCSDAETSVVHSMERVVRNRQTPSRNPALPYQSADHVTCISSQTEWDRRLFVVLYAADAHGLIRLGLAVQVHIVVHAQTSLSTIR